MKDDLLIPRIIGFISQCQATVTVIRLSRRNAHRLADELAALHRPKMDPDLIYKRICDPAYYTYMRGARIVLA